MENKKSLQDIIKDFAKEKNLSIRQLCKIIGMTENGLAASLKNSTIKLDTLYKICKALEVDEMDMFFAISGYENKDHIDDINLLDDNNTGNNSVNEINIGEIDFKEFGGPNLHVKNITIKYTCSENVTLEMLRLFKPFIDKLINKHG